MELVTMTHWKSPVVFQSEENRIAAYVAENMCPDCARQLKNGVCLHCGECTCPDINMSGLHGNSMVCAYCEAQELERDAEMYF